MTYQTLSDIPAALRTDNSSEGVRGQIRQLQDARARKIIVLDDDHLHWDASAVHAWRQVGSQRVRLQR